MSVTLEQHKFDGLASTLDVAARPFDFDTPDSWRVELLRRIMRLTEAKAAHFDIDNGGFERVGVYLGYDDDVTRAWATEWRHRDPALKALSNQSLSTYSRRWRYRLLGSEWEAQYRKSEVFNEFYRRSELDVDAAGIYVFDQALHVHVHVDHVAQWSEQEDAQARAMMSLLRPVISASVRAVASRNSSAFSLKGLLESLEVEAAVVDTTTAVVHCSAALERSLAAHGTEEEAHRWKVQAGAVARRYVTALDGRGLVPMPTTTELCGRRVSLAVVRDTPFGSGPLVVLRVEQGDLPLECPRTLAPLQLTHRQWAVARLVAMGFRNNDIADALQISVHTSRRHVEAVLAKFGVDSRAGVATVVWRALR